jgi:hypothetical protein
MKNLIAFTLFATSVYSDHLFLSNKDKFTDKREKLRQTDPELADITEVVD